MTPTAVARDTALLLAAEMDPGLPACVDRALKKSDGTGPEAVRGADLGSFIVVSAHMGCQILTDLRRKTDRPARPYLADRLRSAMGIDEGMSHDHDNVIDAVVATLLGHA